MIPFLRPAPPSLRALDPELREIEASGVFTNYGPTNARFEAALQDGMFADGGACLTVCNATLGLMIAMRAALERTAAGSARPRPVGPRYALMPSFTFAAAAMAADWIGLTPLFCDIDPEDWAASADAEAAMIRRHGDEIAVIVPYATFGNGIDLDRYERLSAQTGIPVVIDAAASLGSLDALGRPFGSFCPLPVVFSMHATKTFSTAEGGVIHSSDPELVRQLRVMANFGFGAPRTATMPGLNAKLSEVGALLALGRLRDFDSVVRHREALARCYQTLLPGWTFQKQLGARCAFQFMPVLLPPALDGRRDAVVAGMQAGGVGTATYFSPHLAEQPFFRERALAGELPVTDRVARRMLSLPIWDAMTADTVATVCHHLVETCRSLTPAPEQPMPEFWVPPRAAPAQRLNQALAS